MVFKVAFGFLAKMVGFKKGSLFVLSAVMSTGIIYYLDKLTVGTDTKNLIIPVFAHFFGFIFFMSFSTVDLITGLQAAKYLNSKLDKPKERYVKSYKLYRTLWKELGICLLTSMIMLLCVFMEIIDSNYAYWITLWALLGLWLMACGFEFHSIGENLEKRGGSKPPIFGFWEKVLDAVQKKAIDKIDSSFNVLENDDREKEDNNSKTE